MLTRRYRSNLQVDLDSPRTCPACGRGGYDVDEVRTGPITEYMCAFDAMRWTVDVRDRRVVEDPHDGPTGVIDVAEYPRRKVSSKVGGKFGTCHDCGREFAEWYTADSIWRDLPQGDRRKVLCVSCFVRAAKGKR